MAIVTFIDAAIEDLNALDGSMLKPVLSKIAQLENNVELGQSLGRRQSGNLTTFRKLTVGNREIRIVYRVDPDATVCVIWVIAGRADNECYTLAVDRLGALGDNPAARPLADALSVLRPAVVRRLPPEPSA